MTKSLPMTPALPTIDVIVPVYKDLIATRACLESVFASTNKLNFNIIVINDASPESQISEYLNEINQSGKIILLTNKENLGFVKSVNLGMQYHPQNDVLLLNSDTIVANDWLDRLQDCAYREQTIATITPFSNNATICSYPKIAVENSISKEFSISAIDNMFANCNKGYYFDIPTAVGFCMFIKRICLNRIGYFDEIRFPKGYGEENDFCLRAATKGYRNVIACDVFVYHQGSASFGETKKQLMINSQKVLNKSYPPYPLQVQKFIADDPLKRFRQRIDISRLQHTTRYTYLFIMHDGEGGVLKHIKDLIKYFDNKINFLILTPKERLRFNLYWANENEALSISFKYNKPRLLFEFMKVLRIDHVHIHHTLGVMNILPDLLQYLKVPYDITLHDYYSFCPQISLTDKNGVYCHLPDSNSCQQCLKQRPTSRHINIREWRNEYLTFLSNAQRVFVPSMSSLALFRKYFNNVNFIFAPHLDSNSLDQTPFLRDCKYHEPLKILIVGAISKMKGANILAQCAKLAKKQQLPLEFHLLGFAEGLRFSHSHLHFHGRYLEDELQDKIKKINPHLAWFPTLWPETYSYTLSACMEAKLPIVTTDLGAQAERIHKRSLSFIKPWQTTIENWNEFFIEFKNLCESKKILVSSNYPTIQKNYFQYQTEYMIVKEKVLLNENVHVDLLLDKINALRFYSFKLTLRFIKKRIYRLMAWLYIRGMKHFIPEKTFAPLKDMLKKRLMN